MKESSELASLLDSINAAAGIEIISNLPPNPFVGLRPFESEEDTLFFGRREQTIELLQMLNETRFLSVIGSSGCGKSSLIRAGLIPKLKAGFMVEQRDHEQRDQWSIATMRPGESPLHNLVVALLTGCGEEVSDDNINALSNAIRAKGAQAIVERLSPLFPQLDMNLLLLVDQFEEIFAFGKYTGGAARGDEVDLAKRRDEANECVALMIEVSKQRTLPVYVVITMRSEFLGYCETFYGLPEAINRSQYLVPRLTRQQRQEAIEKPIALFGEGIAPRLLDRVLNDVGEESDQLPIMQHAMMRTWDQWKKRHGGPIDLEDYEAAGTVSDALRKDAEQALLETGQPALTRRIFQILTNTDEDGNRVRRPAHISEVEQVTDAGRETILDVIKCFQTDNRSFLILRQGKTKDDLQIDISHESLIRQWSTLRDWVDEEADSSKSYLRIAEAATRHQAREEGLWRNPALQRALKWRADNNPNEAWARRYDPEFKKAMVFLDRSRQRQRLKLLLFGVLTLAGIMTILFGFGVYARSRADRARSMAAQANLELQKQNVKAEQENLRLQQEKNQADQAKSIADLQAIQTLNALANANIRANVARQEQIKIEIAANTLRQQQQGKIVQARQEAVAKKDEELRLKDQELGAKEKALKERIDQYEGYKTLSERLGSERQCYKDKLADPTKECPN